MVLQFLRQFRDQICDNFLTKVGKIFSDFWGYIESKHL